MHSLLLSAALCYLILKKLVHCSNTHIYSLDYSYFISGGTLVEFRVAKHLSLCLLWNYICHLLLTPENNRNVCKKIWICSSHLVSEKSSFLLKCNWCMGRRGVHWWCTNGVNPSSHKTNQNGVVLISIVRGRCMHWQCISVFSTYVYLRLKKYMFIKLS